MSETKTPITSATAAPAVMHQLPVMAPPATPTSIQSPRPSSPVAVAATPDPTTAGAVLVKSAPAKVVAVVTAPAKIATPSVSLGAINAVGAAIEATSAAIHNKAAMTSATPVVVASNDAYDMRLRLLSREVNVDDEILVHSFDASAAQARANKSIENDIRVKLTEHKKRCISQIKDAITAGALHCIFTLVPYGTHGTYGTHGDGSAVDITSDKHNLYDSFFKYFVHDLKFCVTRPNAKSGEFLIRWQTEELVRLSPQELKEEILKIERTLDTKYGNLPVALPTDPAGTVSDHSSSASSSSMRYSKYFSVYHAIEYERAILDTFLDRVIGQLLATCLRRVQYCVDKLIQSTMFEISYKDYKLEKEVHRNAVFDGLVREMRKRKYKLDKLNPVHGRFEIECYSPIQVTSSEGGGHKSGSSSGTAGGGTSSDAKSGQLEAVQPRNRDEARIIHKQIFSMTCDWAIIGAKIRSLNDGTLNVDYKTKLSLLQELPEKHATLGTEITRLACGIIACFPSEQIPSATQ
jgi:hypothetical protein